MTNVRLPLIVAVGLLAAAACSKASAPTPPPIQPPVAVVSPSPSPLPVPSPSPTPCPDGSCGNTRPVVRSQLALYELFDKDRNLVPAPDPIRGVVDPIKVGYTMRLDVTGRDADGRETDGCGRIDWSISDQSVVEINARSPWTHDFTILKPGTLTVYTVFCGVGSNDLHFTFVP